MSADTPEGNESPHDSDETARIARERLADALDTKRPDSEAGVLGDVIGGVAERLREDDLRDIDIHDALTSLQQVESTLNDAAVLTSPRCQCGAESGAFQEGRGGGDSDVSRDDLGSSRITVSETATAYVYDEGEEDKVEISDLYTPDGKVTATLTADEARALRNDLDVALGAISAEREYYDVQEDRDR